MQHHILPLWMNPKEILHHWMILKRDLKTYTQIKEITGVYRFKISDIEINNDDSDAPKIKLTTTTSIPTLF